LFQAYKSTIFLSYQAPLVYNHKGFLGVITEGSIDQGKIQWEKQMPIAEKPQMEKIVDQRKTYFEYLVKWKGHPIEDASWESEADIQKHGKSVQELMDRSP
jgi:hypothetical protein